MDLVDQRRRWRADLQELQATIAGTLQAEEVRIAEEVVRACLASLDEDLPDVLIRPLVYRRSIDLIVRPYVETDGNCVIRRANKAMLTFIPPDVPVIGTPFLMWIIKEDRARFLHDFLKLTGKNPEQRTQIAVKIMPQLERIVPVEIAGNRVEGRRGALLGIIWLLKTIEPWTM